MANEHKTLATRPYASWTKIQGKVTCTVGENALTFTGSGTSWSTNGSSISIKSSNGSSNPNYHILQLVLPEGYQWPSSKDTTPNIEFNRGKDSGIYTDFGRLPLFNTLSGTQSVVYSASYRIYDTESQVTQVTGGFTISFLKP